MRMRSSLALSVLVAATVSSRADRIPELDRTRAVGSAGDSVDHDFTRVTSVRELADGRVLVVDAGERSIIVVDFSTRRARVVGQSGSGPNEYRSVGRLIALAADSTLIADRANGRYLLLFQDRIVGAMDPASPVVGALGFALLGADPNGHLFASRAVTGELPRDVRHRPRSVVLRFNRHNGALDTLVSMLGAEVTSTQVGRPPRATFSTVAVTLSVPEQAAIDGRGSVAILRQEPYRVDWIGRDGRTRRGPALESGQQLVTEDDKTAWSRRMAEESGRDVRALIPSLPWAKYTSPVRENAFFTLAGERLLVGRSLRADSPTSAWDVIDRRGLRTTQISFAANTSVVGVGSRGLYVVVTGNDGFQRLTRVSTP